MKASYFGLNCVLVIYYNNITSLILGIWCRRQNPSYQFCDQIVSKEIGFEPMTSNNIFVAWHSSTSLVSQLSSLDLGACILKRTADSLRLENSYSDPFWKYISTSSCLFQSHFAELINILSYKCVIKSQQQ